MRLIDADALNDSMYHEAFETDSELQKWDSGCWIRYKMFENHLDMAPTADAAPVVRCGECDRRIKSADLTEWNRRAHPENKPLTLDELKQMYGEPIWMGRAKEWIFVASVADAPYAQVWYFNSKGFAQTVLYHHEKFYRSKPKEVEHD